MKGEFCDLNLFTIKFSLYTMYPSTLTMISHGCHVTQYNNIVVHFHMRSKHHTQVKFWEVIMCTKLVKFCTTVLL